MGRRVAGSFRSRFHNTCVGDAAPFSGRFRGPRLAGTHSRSGRERCSDNSCCCGPALGRPALPAWAAAAEERQTPRGATRATPRTVKNARMPEGGGSSCGGRRNGCHCELSRGGPAAAAPPPPRGAEQSRDQWPGWPHLKQLFPPAAPSPPRPAGAAGAAFASASASRSLHAVAVQWRQASSSYFSLRGRAGVSEASLNK